MVPKLSAHSHLARMRMLRSECPSALEFQLTSPVKQTTSSAYSLESDPETSMDLCLNSQEEGMVALQKERHDCSMAPF